MNLHCCTYESQSHTFTLEIGRFLTVSCPIEFEIRIQGHFFRFSALIAGKLVGLDLILSQETKWSYEL